MNKLRNCPFCGSVPFVYEIEAHSHHFIKLPDFEGSWYVECTACGKALASDPEKEKAITAWNCRAEPSLREVMQERDRMCKAYKPGCKNDSGDSCLFLTEDEEGCNSPLHGFASEKDLKLIDLLMKWSEENTEIAEEDGSSGSEKA